MKNHFLLDGKKNENFNSNRVALQKRGPPKYMIIKVYQLERFILELLLCEIWTPRVYVNPLIHSLKFNSFRDITFLQFQPSSE